MGIKLVIDEINYIEINTRNGFGILMENIEHEEDFKKQIIKKHEELIAGLLGIHNPSRCILLINPKKETISILSSRGEKMGPGLDIDFRNDIPVADVVGDVSNIMRKINGAEDFSRRKLLEA